MYKQITYLLAILALISVVSSALFDIPGSFEQSLLFCSGGTCYQRCQLVDLNGDGLPDWLCSFTEGIKLFNSVYLNNGCGWVDAKTLTKLEYCQV